MNQVLSVKKHFIKADTTYDNEHFSSWDINMAYWKGLRFNENGISIDVWPKKNASVEYVPVSQEVKHPIILVTQTERGNETYQI